MVLIWFSLFCPSYGFLYDCFKAGYRFKQVMYRLRLFALGYVYIILGDLLTFEMTENKCHFLKSCCNKGTLRTERACHSSAPFSMNIYQQSMEKGKDTQGWHDCASAERNQRYLLLSLSDSQVKPAWSLWDEWQQYRLLGRVSDIAHKRWQSVWRQGIRMIKLQKAAGCNLIEEFFRDT